MFENEKVTKVKKEKKKILIKATVSCFCVVVGMYVCSCQRRHQKSALDPQLCHAASQKALFSKDLIFLSFCESCIKILLCAQGKAKMV